MNEHLQELKCGGRPMTKLELLQKENKELKKKINKALDYIKIEFCQINEDTKELECWHKRVEPILDILNGKEYKEEK